MAKRRDSQTSVTIWLDPREVQALDALRGGATRSAWATKLARARLSHAVAAAEEAEAAPTAPPPPPAPIEMIEAAARTVRAQAHGRRVRPELTLAGVVQAVELRRAGLSDAAVARKLGCLTGALIREVDPVEHELARMRPSAHGASPHLSR